MGWFKVDDQLAFHSKTVMAGNEAMGLWVRAGSWASAQLTGGFIAKHMANAMAKECDAIALVEAGLWSEVDGGFQFHDWNEFQPDAEEERKKREETRKARSEAGKKGAQARWSDSKKDDLPSVSHSKPMANEWQPDSKPMPPTRPDLINTSFVGFDSEAPAEEEKKTRKKPSIAIPANWSPTAEHERRAREKNLNVNEVAEAFKLHAEAHDRRAANWNAAFTMWLTKAQPKQATAWG